MAITSRARTWRRLRPGLGPWAGLAATVSTLAQLLVHPVLGLADNGDYKRLLLPLGLKTQVPAGQPPRFQYFWLHYDAGPTTHYAYRDTEYAIAFAVKKLSVIFGLGSPFDLRYMGIAHALLLGIAVWLIVRALTGPLWLRAITALLLVVALTDTRFTVYLNSFYTEPASLLALLFLIAAVLHAWRRPALSLWCLIAIGVSAAALIVSKSQNALLVLPAAGLVLARRVQWPRLKLVGRWRGRVPGAVCAVVLIGISVGYLRGQPVGFERINRYNAVFVELLGNSRHPAQDLADLGLPTGLAKYAGIPVYSPRNATRDPNFQDFYDKMTQTKLAEFYVTHPGRAVELANRGAKAAMYLRPVGVSPPLGNQTLASGAPPYFTACRLCLYSTASQASRSASGLIYPALWAGALAAAFALLFTARRDTSSAGGTSGLAVALIGLVTSAATAMAVALLGEGAFEIVKHLYMTSVCNALIAVLSIQAAGLLIIRRRLSTVRPSHAPTAEPAVERDCDYVSAAGEE